MNKEKMIQFLFTKEIKGNHMKILKDRKIIFYYFKKKYNIHIYNVNTFKILYSIDILSQIKDSKENEGNCILENQPGFYRNKISIKELDNEKILIGLYKYLMELKLYNNSYDFKIIKKLDDILLDINQLSDKRIILFTDKDIIELDLNNKEYNIKKKYKIKAGWKMIQKSLTDKNYTDFNQYFDSHIIQNNKLLLRSFSMEIYLSRKCLNCPYPKISNVKFILIDANNFEEISSTEYFENYIHYIVLDNYLVTKDTYDLISIYDINTLKHIKNIIFRGLSNIYNLENNKIILFFGESIANNFVKIYEIKYNDLIKHSEIEMNFSFDNKLTHDDYIKQIFKNNKCLYKLKDNIFISLCYHRIYIFELYIN